MAYIAAADFRLRTLQPYTAGLTLTEADGSDTYIDAVIAIVTAGVEADLSDDFEPAVGDADETFVTTGNGLFTLYPMRRIRTLTSVSTRDENGALTAEASSSYRLFKSLNAAGTAMVDGRRYDRLQILQGFSLSRWPTAGGSVELVGKFGWAAVPSEIKRLVALRTYGMVKAKADPLTTIVQRTTVDAVLTFGPSAEESSIVNRYVRKAVLAA